MRWVQWDWKGAGEGGESGGKQPQAIARKCEPGNTSVQLGSFVWQWGEPSSKLGDQEDHGGGEREEGGEEDGERKTRTTGN